MSREVRTHAIAPTDHRAALVDSRQLSPEMPRYDQTRLDLALEVFRDSENYRKEKGLEAKNLEKHLTSTHYTLRSGVKTTNTGRTSEWVDKDVWVTSDEDDDYAPTNSKKRRATVSTIKQPTPKRKTSDQIKSGRQNKKSRRTYQWGRKNGQQLVVIVKLTSHAGREEFRRKVATIPEFLGIENDPFESTECWDKSKEPTLVARRGGSIGGRSSFSSDLHSSRLSLLGSKIDDVSRRSSQCDVLGLRNGKKAARKPRLKPRSEVDLHVDVEKKRKRCMPCEQQKLICDLETVGAPCCRCLKSGRGGQCRPYQTPEPGTQLEVMTSMSSGTHSDSPIVIEDEPSTKKIWTRFAHPIDFKLKIAKHSNRTCHFCANFRYGILGCSLEPTEVEVFVKNGRYEELVGGHVARGELPTTMCIRCSLVRLAPSWCPQHVVVPIKGSAADPFPYQETMAHLFGGKDSGSETKWCSFCPHPAFHVCGTRQHVNLVGQELKAGETPVHGCGLLLCPSCSQRVKSYGMDRDRIVADILDSGYRVRADMDFLFRGSDLHKAFSNRLGDYAVA